MEADRTALAATISHVIVTNVVTVRLHCTTSARGLVQRTCRKYPLSSSLRYALYGSTLRASANSTIRARTP
jgi:hypothetical protein